MLKLSSLLTILITISVLVFLNGCSGCSETDTERLDKELRDR